MKNFMNAKILNAVCLLGIGSFVGCAHHDHPAAVAPANGSTTHDTSTDTSHNVFTGSKTVTDTDKQTYTDSDTGVKTKKTVTKKAKYDKNGNKISTSKDVDTSAK